MQKRPISVTFIAGLLIVTAVAGLATCGDNLKNPQLVKDTIDAILKDPATHDFLSGYVGPDAPNLTIQSGDLGPPTVQVLPNGQKLTTTVQGDTAPDIQTVDYHDGSRPTTMLTGATITIDNNTSKDDTPGVLVHETEHAGEARKDPAKFSADSKAEKAAYPNCHDCRPQELRANAAQAAYEKQIKQRIKQTEKERNQQKKEHKKELQQ